MKSKSRKNYNGNGFNEDGVIDGIENGNTDVENHQMNSGKKRQKSGDASRATKEEDSDENEQVPWL